MYMNVVAFSTMYTNKFYQFKLSYQKPLNKV